MQSYINDKESISKADIFWTLNIITKRQSFRSSNSDSLFQAMFPDSEIAIERGFSINKEVLDTNMSEKTIVAQRMISDSGNKELSIEGSKDVSKIKIDKEMLRYCSKASSTYRVQLSEKRQNEKGSIVEAKKSNQVRNRIRRKEVKLK